MRRERHAIAVIRVQPVLTLLARPQPQPPWYAADGWPPIVRQVERRGMPRAIRRFVLAAATGGDVADTAQALFAWLDRRPALPGRALAPLAYALATAGSDVGIRAQVTAALLELAAGRCAVRPRTIVLSALKWAVAPALPAALIASIVTFILSNEYVNSARPGVMLADIPFDGWLNEIVGWLFIFAILALPVALAALRLTRRAVRGAGSVAAATALERLRDPQALLGLSNILDGAAARLRPPSVRRSLYRALLASAEELQCSPGELLPARASVHLAAAANSLDAPRGVACLRLLERAGDPAGLPAVRRLATAARESDLRAAADAATEALEARRQERDHVTRLVRPAGDAQASYLGRPSAESEVTSLRPGTRPPRDEP